MSKTIWKEVEDGLIECLAHGERFRLDGGTCAACVEEAIGVVEFLVLTIPIEEDSHV